jgi:hypothetical protein
MENRTRLSELSRLDEHVDIQIIQPPEISSNRLNQLVFFYKPESFNGEAASHFPAINAMVLDKFASHNVSIQGAVMLSGRFLEANGIMDRHYGYINKVSRGASKLVNPEELSRMEAIAGDKFTGYHILGGHEFLKAFPMYDEVSLNSLWLSKPSLKIRSGFYFQTFEISGKSVLLLNGFHPNQLAHFTRPGQKILLYLVNTDTNWKILKDDMAGDTFPEKAVPGSIRGELFCNREKYGASDISVSHNFIHLSAGPFEAYYEMWNFLSLTESGFDLSSTNIGTRMLSSGYEVCDLERVLQNPMLEMNGKQKDLFSCTENMNSDKAVKVYQPGG